MQFKSLVSNSSSFETSPRKIEEIAPGVKLLRRAIFQLSALTAFCALANSKSTLAGGFIEPLPTNRLQLEELIAKIRPEATQLISSIEPDEASYVARMAHLLSQSAELEKYRNFPGGEGWTMEPTAFVPPILLYQIDMQPGAKIDIHDHRYHNGVLCVQKGEARLRCFEPFVTENEPNSVQWNPLADTWPDPGVEFTLQRTRDEVIRVGATATLTRTSDNIHELQAGPEGCRLLDLFTNFKPIALSMRIKWNGEFVDEPKGLCRVSYIAPDHIH